MYEAKRAILNTVLIYYDFATGSYPDPTESNSCPQNLFLSELFPLTLGIPISRFCVQSSVNIYIISAMRATCPVRLIATDFPTDV